MRVAISAGHHNSDGGSPVEYAITGELCEAYYRAFKAAGVDVRVITPDGPDADSDPGDGMFPGGLQQVAQKVVDWAAQGWPADLFLECHTQGLGDTSVRGCFAIYPDWGGDLDQTVKDVLGRKICQAVSAASGIPIYGNGLMSEKATGVGIDGYRLGIFLRTAPVAAKTTRLIVEHGAHSNPQDLAILRTPGMLDKIASAGAKAIMDYFGAGSGNGTAVPNIPAGMVALDNPNKLDIYQDAWSDPATSLIVLQPFANFYRDNGGLEKFGRPTSGMYGELGSQEQQFKYAHLYVDKPSGKVIAEMKDRVNPDGFSIGQGAHDTLVARGFEAITNEQFYTANSGQDLGQRSFTWAKDPDDGQVYILIGVEHPEQKKPDGTIPWEMKVVKEV